MKYSLSGLIKDLLSRVWHLENDHIPASRLSGTVNVDNLPDRSKNKILVVSNDTARFKLTKATVSEGDIIKVSSTKSTYVISDLNNLSNNNGYVELSVNNSVVADSLAKSIPDGSNNVDIIRTKMGTDLFRINVGTNGTDNGFVSFDMADNGDECIYFRQYGGSGGTFKTIANQVTLLDGSGNTHFPHNVYATSFNGALNGNATSATKASTIVNNGAGNMVFHWSGQGGQPTWLFGSNDGVNAYVWNPSNFSVNYAKSAGAADKATTANTASSVAWSGVTGKPGTYPPSAHNHDSAYPSVTGARASGTWGINISGNAASATKAVNDGNGTNIANTYVKKAGDTTTGKITFASTNLNALPEVKKTSDDNMSGIRFSSKTKFLGAVGKRLSNGEDLLNLRSDNSSTDVVLDSRNYNNYAPTKTGAGASGTWGINITGNAKTATNVAWSGVTGKPITFTPSSHAHSWDQVGGKPVTATRWPSWQEVTGKPSNVIRVKSWDATNGVLILESV